MSLLVDGNIPGGENSREGARPKGGKLSIFDQLPDLLPVLAVSLLVDGNIPGGENSREGQSPFRILKKIPRLSPDQTMVFQTNE